MAVLFDLDGTLTDPKVGIVTSIRYALEHLGVEVPLPDDLEWCIGPPLYESFRIILKTDDPARIASAMASYRERFSTIGLFENALYPGIVASLERLQKERIPLFVATSKPSVFARRILDRFDLTRFFSGVYGSEHDGRLSSKGELIRHLLLEEDLDYRRTIMVGDREHDVLGARANGVACLGVTYGYGSDSELDVAGAAALCHRPESVAQAILALQSTLALSCDPF